jgi:uncharacterized membrane protein
MVVSMSVQMRALNTAPAQVKNTAHVVSTILSKAKTSRMPNPQHALSLTRLRVHQNVQDKQNHAPTANQVFDGLS